MSYQTIFKILWIQTIIFHDFTSLPSDFLSIYIMQLLLISQNLVWNELHVRQPPLYYGHSSLHYFCTNLLVWSNHLLIVTIQMLATHGWGELIGHFSMVGQPSVRLAKWCAWKGLGAQVSTAPRTLGLRHLMVGRHQLKSSYGKFKVGACMPTKCDEYSEHVLATSVHFNECCYATASRWV